MLDTIQASQNICGEIKSLVTSAHKCKIEARKKINDALSQSIEEAKTQQVCYNHMICMEFRLYTHVSCREPFVWRRVS